ncbi:glycosyltransferase family 2 protein [uncultured Mameliella sp.]|uniref:glycosyltransferase family 2 protein n=1 Tax=uncultured Mameliella sp. TaxID=1447087 RepID=UPI00261378C9|nr:glycosyltransferase family 2 protein [uncultured Mameliella sp.]
MSRTPTYKGGIKAVLDQYEARRAPLPGDGGLPPADVDLAALAASPVTDPAQGPFAPPFADNLQRKTYQLREELQGSSELTVLHGLTISHLRKRAFPDQAPLLFQRMWAEQADHLLGQLDARWLVSAVTTFGDHGATPVQRSTGLALTALFGMMKLYESERLYSGKSPEKPFPVTDRIKAKLPLQMDSYALVGGGLDVNLIARLWQEAEGDAVIRPLAHHLLDLLIHDPAGVFRRLAIMAARKERRTRQASPQTNDAPVPARPRKTPETLRWGLVSTVKAPLPQIARFAAHHIDMGAHELHLYLDAPDADAAAFLGRHPRIHVTQCDTAYWQASGRNRMAQHQLRQAFNATRALRASAEALDWLGHIDHDEFLLTNRPVAEILSGVAQDKAIARIPPAEALAREDGPPRHFKLTHKQAGIKKSQLQEIYPTFGLHLFGGFLSHTGGKIFARPGIPDTRLGIHTLKYKGEDATNRIKPDGIYLAHFHAPDWAHFRSHLDFRREKGSYRASDARPEMGQGELLSYLQAEEGEAGLRAFFDEICADTPALRERLSRHGMLLAHEFDFDASVRRVFGTLP